MDKPHKRYKKYSLILACSFITVIVVAFIFGAIYSAVYYIDPKEYGVFSSITEFEDIINSNGFEKLTVEKDKHIKSLVYTEKAEFKFKAGKKTYKTYAYVFPDETGAQQYFKNVTGKNGDYGISSFSQSSNFYFYTRLIVYKDNKAYKIEGENYWESQKIIKLFNNELHEALENFT